MFLLDTDHLIVIQHQSDPEFSRLHARMALHPPAEFHLAIVSFREQMLGVNTLISRSQDQSRVVRGYQLMEHCLIDFNRFQVLPFDEPASREFVRLRQAKVRIETMDLRIAAIALSQQLTVLSRNALDFCQVPGLLVEDWTK